MNLALPNWPGLMEPIIGMPPRLRQSVEAHTLSQSGDIALGSRERCASNAGFFPKRASFQKCDGLEKQKGPVRTGPIRSCMSGPDKPP